VFEPGRRGPIGGGNMRTDRKPVFDLQVEAGRTLRYEHDARPQLNARLMGRVQVDGAPPGPALVSVRTSTRHAAITSYERTLDPDGRFELALQAGLDTSVSVRLRGDGDGLSISGRPVIVEGRNEWSVELHTAVIEGVSEPRDAAMRHMRNQLTYESRCGDAVVRAACTLDESGRFGPVRVGAGHGELRGPPPDFRSPGPVLTEIDLKPGERRDLGRLPR
jgi:hypothetical protein